MKCSQRRLTLGQEWELEMQGTNHEEEWSCGKLEPHALAKLAGS